MNKNALSNEEKIKLIQHCIDNPNTEELYYNLLEDLDCFTINYIDQA